MAASVILDGDEPALCRLVHYRLYFLDQVGRIARGLDLECADDAAALEVVGRHAHLHGIELWRAAERIASVAPGASSDRAGHG